MSGLKLPDKLSGLILFSQGKPRAWKMMLLMTPTRIELPAIYCYALERLLQVAGKVELSALPKTIAPFSHPAAASSVSEAFAYCERLARTHYENFPVGSWLVPKDRRLHFYSIYAFARVADDFADEGYDTALTPEARLAALDDWEQRLEDCHRHRASHPIFLALGETIKELDLPIQPFRDLISAFKQDVLKRRYASFDEVLDYCRRSANPVGRLILLLFGYRDEHLHQLSDWICTGLQLANFWQDVSVDIQKDRIYLPQDEMASFGCGEEQLRQLRFDERYAELLRFQVERTRELFARGRPLPELVGGRLRFELRLIWQGGMCILKRIEQSGYDTLSRRPEITRLDQVLLLARALI
jgi:squalene synthase HpnC